MEFKSSQSNRVVQGQAMNDQRTGMNMNDFQSNSKKVWMAIAGLVVVIVLICGGMWLWRTMNTGVKGGQYQALFMTNGQVYFGHLSGVDEKYVNLKDIYYLQVQQSVQPAEKKDKDAQPQVSLAKLGSELHGPEDEMHINREQVLFWENLKDDSKVVKAIQDAQKQ